MGRFWTVGVCALAAVFLGSVSPASALVMRTDQGILTADDFAGSANVVTLTSPGPNQLRIEDSAGMSPGAVPTCVADGPQAVICTVNAFVDATPQVNLGAGDDRLTLTDGLTVPVRVGAQGGDDRLTGNAGGNFLAGGPGEDVIFGLRGPDDLRGGAGDDVCFGAAGNDECHGSRDADRCVMGSGKDECFGNSGTDVCLAGTGKDFCSGGKGRDRCDGGPGSDMDAACEIRLNSERVVPK